MPQLLGGAALAAAGLLECVNNQLSLLVGDDLRQRGLATTWVRSIIWSGGQVLAADHVVAAQQNRPLDTVLQFTDVARPVIARQHVDRGCRDSRDMLAVLGGETLRGSGRPAA